VADQAATPSPRRAGTCTTHRPAKTIELTVLADLASGPRRGDGRRREPSRATEVAPMAQDWHAACSLQGPLAGRDLIKSSESQRPRLPSIRRCRPIRAAPIAGLAGETSIVLVWGRAGPRPINRGGQRLPCNNAIVWQCSCYLWPKNCFGVRSLPARPRRGGWIANDGTRIG
jgi:hypothetical protein